MIETTKIGDYVHYNKLDYLFYGIGKRGYPIENGSVSVSQALDLQKKRILQEAQNLNKGYNKKVIKEKIENQLNYFRSTPNISINTSWNVDEIEKKIHETVRAFVDVAIDNYDPENLSVYGLQAGDLYTNSIRLQKDVSQKNITKLLSENGKNDIASVNERLAIFANTLKYTAEHLSMDVSVIQQELQQLRQRWNDIISTGLQNKTINNNSAYIFGQQDFIKDLNAFWIRFKGKTESYLTGQVAEYYAAICQDIIKNCANKTTQEVLNYIEAIIPGKTKNNQLGWIANDRSKTALSKDFFAITGQTKTASDSHFVNKAFTNFSGGTFKQTATQNKADLLIQLDDLEIPASIKKYNFQSASTFGISLHTGVSILSLTQEYCNFMNHYLNITSQSSGSSAIPANNERMSYYIKMANQVLRLTMGFKALTGGIYKLDKSGTFGKQREAEVFIANSNNGLYRVYFVDDIINAFVKNLSLLQIQDLDDNTRWENIWIESNEGLNYSDAYSRINHLLQQLHNQQLQIKFSPTILSQIN